MFDYYLFDLVSTLVGELHIYVFDCFLFNLVSTSVGELRESACLLLIFVIFFSYLFYLKYTLQVVCLFFV